MSSPEIADIFRAGFEDYIRSTGGLPMEHYKVAHAIMACRTEELGGHLYRCDSCGHERIVHNSCGNRHCPKCQSLARVQWVQARISELLPVPYFHAVFTLPSELNPFVLRNKASAYALLFQTVSETLAVLSAEKKFLGARTGFILVLHSWGQNLMDHPHIHCIIPGGGFEPESEKWKPCKTEFLFPVKVMSSLFKGKFMSAFKHAVEDEQIGLHGSLSEFKDQARYKGLLNGLYKKKWVTYVKPPFAGPQAVLKYLGSYTHRIAISNHRILSFRNNQVSFSWKDYHDQQKKKIITLSTHEFIRRFLLHVVPNGFMRIRHYGILSNRCKTEMLAVCRKLLTGRKEEPAETEAVVKKEKKKWHEVVLELTGADPRICPYCKKGMLVEVQEIPKLERCREGTS